MTNEERVARAICSVNVFDPDENGADGGPMWKTWIPDARAAIAAMEPEIAAARADGWRPISTAPKDGTLILVHVAHDVMDVVSWWDGRWRETANALGLRDEPAYWMPLPNPPAAAIRNRSE